MNRQEYLELLERSAKSNLERIKEVQSSAERLVQQRERINKRILELREAQRLEDEQNRQERLKNALMNAGEALIKWRTADGTLIAVKDLETSHLINCIALTWRMAAARSRLNGRDRLEEERSKSVLQALLAELKRRDVDGVYL